MSNRQVLLYFAWSRPAETGAPLAVIDDRFPAVFELRRLFYPKFEISLAATVSILASAASSTTSRSRISPPSPNRPKH